MTVWDVIKEDSYPQNQEKKVTKKYKELVSNVLKNLATYVEVLNNGVHPEQAKRTLSFVHEEKKGLVAIDQRPPVGGTQLRLYVYPNIETKKIHIIAIGNKQTQQADIKLGHNIIKEIQNGTED